MDQVTYNLYRWNDTLHEQLHAVVFIHPDTCKTLDVMPFTHVNLMWRYSSTPHKRCYTPCLCIPHHAVAIDHIACAPALFDTLHLHTTADARLERIITPNDEMIRKVIREQQKELNIRGLSYPVASSINASFLSSNELNKEHNISFLRQDHVISLIARQYRDVPILAGSILCVSFLGVCFPILIDEITALSNTFALFSYQLDTPVHEALRQHTSSSGHQSTPELNSNINDTPYSTYIPSPEGSGNPDFIYTSKSHFLISSDPLPKHSFLSLEETQWSHSLRANATTADAMSGESADDAVSDADSSLHGTDDAIISIGSSVDAASDGELVGRSDVSLLMHNITHLPSDDDLSPLNSDANTLSVAAHSSQRPDTTQRPSTAQRPLRTQRRGGVETVALALLTMAQTWWRINDICAKYLQLQRYDAHHHTSYARQMGIKPEFSHVRLDGLFEDPDSGKVRSQGDLNRNNRENIRNNGLETKNPYGLCLVGLHGRSGVGKTWLLSHIFGKSEDPTLGKSDNQEKARKHSQQKHVLSAPALMSPRTVHFDATKLYTASSDSSSGNENSGSDNPGMQLLESWMERIHRLVMESDTERLSDDVNEIDDAGQSISADLVENADSRLLREISKQQQPIIVIIDGADIALTADDDSDDDMDGESAADAASQRLGPTGELLEQFLRGLAHYSRMVAPIMAIITTTTQNLPKSWYGLAAQHAEVYLTPPGTLDRQWLLAYLLLEQYQGVIALARHNGHAALTASSTEATFTEMKSDTPISDSASSPTSSADVASEPNQQSLSNLRGAAALQPEQMNYVTAAFLNHAGIAENMHVGNAEEATKAFISGILSKFPEFSCFFARKSSEDDASVHQGASGVTSLPLPSSVQFTEYLSEWSLSNPQVFSVLPACVRQYIANPTDYSAQLVLTGNLYINPTPNTRYNIFPIEYPPEYLILAKLVELVRFPGLLTVAETLTSSVSGLTPLAVTTIFTNALTRHQSLSLTALTRSVQELKQTDTTVLSPYLLANPLAQHSYTVAQRFQQENQWVLFPTPLSHLYTHPELASIDATTSSSCVQLKRDDDSSKIGELSSMSSVVSTPWRHIYGYQSTVRRLQQLCTQWTRSGISIGKAQNPNSSRIPGMGSLLGQAIPSGVLLYGPSGCGKTLFTQVISAASGLNTLQMGCADIFQKYLGESEKKVRELFAHARELAPCIVILDELDVIAPNRNSISAGSSTGVELRVLSTLLNEMDGIEGRNGVFVLGVCRAKENIDAALIRPGRFDEVIALFLPSETDRKAIIFKLLGKALNMTGEACVEEKSTSLEMTTQPEHGTAGQFGSSAFANLTEKASTIPPITQIVSRTQGFTCAQVCGLCRHVVDLACKRYKHACKSEGKKFDIEDVRANMFDIEAAFADMLMQRRHAKE